MSSGIKTNKFPIKVAFLMIGGSQWMGGYNYLVNLLSILKMDTRVYPVLFLGNDVEQKLLDPLLALGFDIVFDNVFNLSSRKKNVITASFIGRNNYIENIFLNHEIDVVFEAAMYLGWNTKIPRLSWLPDFQHKYLSKMFSKVSWWQREIVFRLIGLNRTILLSSQDAKKDYLQFYGLPKYDIQVVPFAVRKPDIDESKKTSVLDKYNIENEFFYLPNQFWQHKNHSVVIEALGMLKKKKKEILVVTTGNCTDDRMRTHCDMLKRLIVENNVENNFILLGSIPYHDVLLLMKGSCAVINPSFFEGWSTTVEEAKALNIPLILSDISVHREQVSNALFFNPNSALELAELLVKYLSSKNKNIDYNINIEKNVEEYKDNFLRALINASKLNY